MATLVSVNVGLPKDVDWHDRTVHTGIYKRSVSGPTMARRLNLDGDGQGDLNGHGGEQRAVLVYQLDSYAYWQEYFGRDDFEYGQFGENFTVDGLPDGEVCVGDRFRIGEAEFEVTQPRVTCYRVGLRMGEPQLPSLLVAHHRPGFYLRVIEEGHVQAGDEIVRTRRGPEAISVADIDALLYLPNKDRATLAATLNIPALSPGWQQSFRELLAEEPPPAKPQWAGFRPLRIAKTVHENAAVLSITFSDDQPLPAFEPGQYLTVRTPNGAVRSYSLSSATGDGTYRVSVKREGPASISVHEKFRAGVTAQVAAPRGEFVLEPGDKPIVLASAGIGITPVLAMLYGVAATQPHRPVWWIHITRDPAFTQEVDDLLGRLDQSQRYVFDHGRPSRDQLEAIDLPTDASAYICGPETFMADFQQFLADAGLEPDRIHTELFGALPSINPGLTDHRAVPPHQPDGEPGTGPLVTFARSGLSVPWSDQRRSLLELADACDVQTRWSCRTGVCHTCVTPIVTGEVRYSPDPLEPPPAGEILVCCSQPLSDVVLDL